MLIFQPPVNFCSDKNIQTIFGTKLISQTVEKVVKKYFLGRRNNSTSSGLQSAKKYFFHNFFESLGY
jgi:hypothetical protein